MDPHSAASSPGSGASRWTLWLDRDDPALLQQCVLETFRASGPGGQKRNKTSSAVRIVHTPTGCTGASSESRSQHDNKATALHRLRLNIALTQRVPSLLIRTPDDWDQFTRGGRIVLRPKDPLYPQRLAHVLDVLAGAYYAVHVAARELGVSSAALSNAITSDELLLTIVNRERKRLELKPLRPT